MSWFSAARTRLGLMLGRGSAESRMDEEFGFHIEMETERLLRVEGLSPDDARRKALVAFGGVEKYKEQLRAERGLAWLGGMALDFKLGARMLRKSPWLTVVACIALSIAIGAGASYLEIMNDLYRPRLQFEDGDRIIGIRNWDLEYDRANDRSYGDYMLWRARARSIDDVAAFKEIQRNVVGRDKRIEPVRGAEVSASTFTLLRARPHLGRVLMPRDEVIGGPLVVVLGYDVWKERFESDPFVIGTTVMIGGAPYQIVGVMPDGFGFPLAESFWIPLRLDEKSIGAESSPELRFAARLADGSDMNEARRELAALSPSPRFRPLVDSYVSSLFTDREELLQRRILYSINILFITLLAICATNVATLVFARTATREGELSVRNALGASRARLAGQLFIEALVLTTLAGLIGLTGAAFVARYFYDMVMKAAGILPFWWRQGLGIETLIYAALLIVIAAAIIGLIPALKATGRSLLPQLRQAAVGGQSVRFGRVWTGVIITQVAITVIFLSALISIGYNVRSGRYGNPQVTVRPQDYLIAQIEMDNHASPGESTAMTEAQLSVQFDSLTRVLKQGLVASGRAREVTIASRIPGMGNPVIGVAIEGVPTPTEDHPWYWTRMVAVDADFFATFNARIVAGRAFTQSEMANHSGVAIVDETFAKRWLKHRNPIGARVTQVADNDGAIPPDSFVVVGVIKPLALPLEESKADPVFYTPLRAGSTSTLFMAAYTPGNTKAAAGSIRTAASDIDPRLRLHRVMPMNETGSGDQLMFDFLLRGFTVVVLVALLLSTAGIYSLMSFTVAQRTREIGIRAALGAAPRRIVTAIFSRTFRHLLIGVIAGGIPGTLLLSNGAPEVAGGGGANVALLGFGVIGGFIMTVGLLAALAPARRALRIQPTEALKAAG